LEQLVLRDLEELIAGEALDDLDERLVVVAAGDEAAALDDPLRLASQHRNLPWARPVGGVRVETEEAALAGARSSLVEALEATVVQIGGSGEPGARIRLCQDWKVSPAGGPPAFPRRR